MRGSGPRPTPLVPGKRCVNQESCSGVNSGGAVVPDVEGVLLGATTLLETLAIFIMVVMQYLLLSFRLCFTRGLFA